MENSTQTFREKINLVFQLTEELQMKTKTVLSTGACVRKECFFVNIQLFVRTFRYNFVFLNIYHTEYTFPLNSLQPLNFLTPRIYDIVQSISLLEKYTIFDHPCSQSIQPADIRNCYFRNKVNWSYSKFEANFFYLCLQSQEQKI